MVDLQPPAGPKMGQRFRDLDDGRLYEWNGTAWVALDEQGETHG